ncbi:twin-arginine translocation signal domain-containing protein [bacterium]|nr:twin-arginine translocation signal domain-containing protein [bacterium]
MEAIKKATSRRDFLKGAAVGATCAGLGIAGVAHASEKAGHSAGSDEAGFAMADLPDTYTHATAPNSKEILSGEQLDAAMQYLSDVSHYLYVNRATPYYGNFTQYPATGFDTDWRSPLNGRPYRGPYFDPLSRSVIWLTTSQNGACNISVGSYWGAIPPKTELQIENHELEDYEPSDAWTIVSYEAPGQTVENFIRNGRGSFCIDASLLNRYGIEDSWGYDATNMPGTFSHRSVLNVEVKLRHYKRRQVTPQEYYDGLAPTTISWAVAGTWAAVDGWGPDAGDDQFRSIPQFWGCAQGPDAALNLASDEERKAYIARAEGDEKLMKALENSMIYLYFDVMQVVNIKQEIGFDFEQGSGKVNGLDMNHDGLLDRYPEGEENAGEIILQNAYGASRAALLPEWAYNLNFKDGWWVAGDGSLINAEGKKIVGANEDGSPILE